MRTILSPRSCLKKIPLEVCALLLALTLSGCATAGKAPQRRLDNTEQAARTVSPKETEEETRARAYSRIQALVASGEMEKAIEECERSLSPERFRADRLLYVRLLILGKHPDRANEVLQKFLIDYPDDTEALYSLSMLEAEAGRFKEQRDLLQRILEFAPGHVEALAALGGICLNEGRLDQAESYFSKALDMDPESFSAVVGMGQTLLNKREYLRAIVFIDRSVALAPDTPFVYSDRARLRKAQSDFSGALEDLNTAIKLDPSLYWNYIDRGKLYLITGKRKNAETDFLEAAKIESDNFYPYVYLAGMYFEDERWEEALLHYRNVVRLRQDYYFAYEPLGILNYRDHDWQEAIRYLNMAFEHNGREYSYALIACLAYRRWGKKEAAEKNLNELSMILPRESWYYEVARFLLRPGYDQPLADRIKNERNQTIKERMLFYLATQYLISGYRNAAQAIFLDLSTAEDSSLIENLLARIELASLSTTE